MSVEKIFKKAQKFFGMEAKDRRKNGQKAKKLIVLLEDKINAMKDKIKYSKDEEKKEKLIKEIDVLKKLKKECKKIYENI